jgi:hypothetical protein
MALFCMEEAGRRWELTDHIRREVIISIVYRELGSYSELCRVDGVLRAPQPVPAGETFVLQQRVGGFVDRDSVITDCELYAAVV